MSHKVGERGMRRIADIGAAVIGTGFIGTVHVEALRRIGVQVRGVLGSNPERGALRAEALGVPRAYGSLDELLADPMVQVVHVTSPNDLHVSQTKAILTAGRHVVCEKPLAMTATGSAELVELAAVSGLINATNFNIRYYPLNQQARETVADGTLGEVRLVTGRYFQDWLTLESDWNWRLQPDRGGALRAVGDIGVALAGPDDLRDGPPDHGPSCALTASGASACMKRVSRTRMMFCSVSIPLHFMQRARVRPVR